VTGIAEIARTGGDWLLRPGHAVDNRADILRKLFDPAHAEKSCEQPWFRFYGYLALLLLSAAFLVTYRAPGRRRP